jgi:hypothetical protein
MSLEEVFLQVTTDESAPVPAAPVTDDTMQEATRE